MHRILLQDMYESFYPSVALLRSVSILFCNYFFTLCTRLFTGLCIQNHEITANHMVIDLIYSSLGIAVLFLVQVQNKALSSLLFLFKTVNRKFIIFFIYILIKQLSSINQ